jgi:hypothetical protein
MEIITTREQIEAIENGSVLADVQGYTIVRDMEGDFMLYAPEQDAWIPIGADEIDRPVIEGEPHNDFLPLTLLTVIPASLMRTDLPRGRF